MQQHEGMIHVYSEPGVGTTFKIYLPADSRLATDIGDKLDRVPPRGQETILLAEDDERVRRAAVQVLQRAGYQTIAAANGVDAVRLLREREEPVDLVVLDLVMPELGGDLGAAACPAPRPPRALYQRLCRREVPKTAAAWCEGPG